MRSIPSDILNKLLLQFQTESNNANPYLKVISTVTSRRTLLSETIKNLSEAGFGDVAVRQLQNEETPSLAYAVLSENQSANIYKRKFPADYDYPWEFLFEIENVKEVAIEFDGTWELSKDNLWYYMQTESLPYIFYTDGSDSLYVQKYDDVSTRTLLAESVSSISAVKGWSSKEFPENDQGIVIAYLREGIAYYRAYCNADNTEKQWEPEREITVLGTENTSLNAFRTNDFRIGFISVCAAGMKYTLSKRNYAGMSVRPEGFKAKYSCFPSTIDYIEIRNLDNTSYEDFNLNQHTDDLHTCLLYYRDNAVASFEVLSAKRENANTLKVKASKPFCILTDVKQSFTVEAPNNITVLSVTVSDGDLIITTTEELPESADAVITHIPYSNLRYIDSEFGNPFVPEFSITATSKPYEAVEGPIYANMLCTLSYFEVHRSSASSEGSHVSLSTTALQNVITYTQVGEVPI